MSTGGRAMAKWLEAKQRRLNGANENSFSIVSSGDEEPVIDPKDKAYRARGPGRSRITSAQTNRDVTPIRTRSSTTTRPSTRLERSAGDSTVNTEETHPSPDDYPPGEDRPGSPTITPPPPLPKSWARYAKKAQLAALLGLDSEGSDSVPLTPPSSKKRGRRVRKNNNRMSSSSPLSKKRRPEAQPFPMPPLSPDFEFPSMADILQASRSNEVSASHRADPPQRSRHRSPPLEMHFFDDEAVEDDGSVAFSDDDGGMDYKDEYDYADSFILQSDVSMKSTTRKEQDRSACLPNGPVPSAGHRRDVHHGRHSEQRYSNHGEYKTKHRSHDATGVQNGQTHRRRRSPSIRHSATSKRNSTKRSTQSNRSPSRKQSSSRRDRHASTVMIPDRELVEITSSSSDTDEYKQEDQVVQPSSTVPHETPSKTKPRPRPIPKRVSAPADAFIVPVEEAGEGNSSTTGSKDVCEDAHREQSPSFESECAIIFKDNILTSEERELMLRALLLSREESKQPTTSKPPTEPSTAKSTKSHESTGSTNPCDSTGKDKAALLPSTTKTKGKAPAAEPQSSKSKGKGKQRAVRTPSPPARPEESDDGLSEYERAQLMKAMNESRRMADSPRTPGETSAHGSAGSSSASAPNALPPATPSTPTRPHPSVTMEDLLKRMQGLSKNIAAPQATAGLSGSSQSPPTPQAGDAASDTSQSSPASQEATGSAQSPPAHPFVGDTSTTRRCTSLPALDETVNESIRDPILRLTYANLCNLRRGHLHPWTDAAGRGQIEFSVWGKWIANLDASIAFDCVTFTEEGPIRNPARASPLDIAMRTVPGTNQRYNFYCATNPAVPLVAVSSGWLEHSQLVALSETGLRQKYVAVIFHTQEWERTVGFIRSASGYPELWAQLSRDALQFSTRSQSTRSLTSPGNTTSKGRAALSKLFRKAPQASQSANSVAGDNFSLPNDATVPVYDARGAKSLDFHKVLPNLSSSLPCYTGGEIPQGSFVMVGYTMTVYRANNGNWTLGCNLQWVVIIGTPEE
ncbi:hypothetical protein DFP72DRAFT_1070646 [Ephemerocybe angulata]|uniref:Uncharacterized protein n=1 Tax=Ephemerocybe angulata TaxID=980116 RepID=A0A8H6HUZ0_9AGAR|nr:hypothetical protein DFP72DRAFT_1070646 [Tulosesus angulatus]